MICKNCGKEIQKGWKVCPNCGVESTKTEENKEFIRKEYHFMGKRRTGNATTDDLGEQIEISTKVIVEGEKVEIFKQNKEQPQKQFFKQDVISIDLPLIPVWKVSDFFRLVVFGLMMFITYGLSIFIFLYSIKIMMSRNIRIKLSSGQTIKIPICQKADASEFLKEFNYSPTEIEKNNAKKMDEAKWLRREKINSKILFIVAAAALVAGLNMKVQNQQSKEVVQNKTDETLLDMEKDNDTTKDTVLMESNEGVEVNTDDIEMYLDNSNKIFPIKVENVYQENVYDEFTTISFDMVNTSEDDIKEATFGISAWDSNKLPLELSEMYGMDSTYFYKCHASNIAVGQTSQGSLTFEGRNFKYIQIFLLEYSNFDGDTWMNPATSYYEENFSGKKFDENTMPALVFNIDSTDEANSTDENTMPESVFNTDNADETNNTIENQEDIVNCTGDFYTDVANGILYGKDGIIVDRNGNALLDYADYFITTEGDVSNGDWVEEGYGVDSTGKIIAIRP